MTPAHMAKLHGESFERGWSEAEVAALLAKPTTLAVSTTHGFALLQIVPPEAEVLTILITPAMRGLGHGVSLLSQALQAASRRGADTVFLDVDATNTTALALYDGAGFARTGTRRAYYAHPDGTRTDAITMTHALKPAIE